MVARLVLETWRYKVARSLARSATELPPDLDNLHKMNALIDVSLRDWRRVSGEDEFGRFGWRPMCCCCLRRAAAGAREACETAVAVASADLLLRLERLLIQRLLRLKRLLKQQLLLLPPIFCWGARYRLSSERREKAMSNGGLICECSIFCMFSTVWVVGESRVRTWRFERRRGFSSLRYSARQRSFRITGNVGVVSFVWRWSKTFLVDEMAWCRIRKWAVWTDVEDLASTSLSYLKFSKRVWPNKIERLPSFSEIRWDENRVQVGS